MFRLLMLMTSFSIFAASFDPVIFSSKNELRKSQMTSNVDIISEEEVDLNVSTSLFDLLRSNASINISESGVGGTQSISIRGAQSRHTLVLIDGIRVNDPTTLDNSFNMSNFSSLDIEKIEVIKGPQSLLYGSDAIGGVINIITKKNGNGGRASIQVGALNEIANSISIYGKRSALYMNAYYNESKFTSAFKDGDEIDNYINRGFLLNYSYVFDKFEIDWQYKLIDNYTEFDSQTADIDGSNRKQINHNFYQKIKAGNLSYNLSYLKVDRDNKTLPFSAFNVERFEGTSVKNEIQYNISRKNNKTILGFQSENIKFEQSRLEEQKTSTYEGFINHWHDFKLVYINSGVRSTTHQEFGNFITYNLGLGRKINSLSDISINYGTGFKSPSLFQLFSDFGNNDLEAEKSKSAEIKYSLRGKNSFEVSIFDTEVTDAIDFVGSTYINTDRIRFYGLDISFSQSFKNSRWLLKESALLTKSHDDSQRFTYRRPGQKINLNLIYNYNSQHSFDFEWYWVSAQKDSFFPAGSFTRTDVDLAAFDITNIVYRYKHKSFEVKAAIRNLFDKDYEEVKNYSTLGLNGYLKLSLNY